MLEVFHDVRNIRPTRRTYAYCVVGARGAFRDDSEDNHVARRAQ